ncbi:LysM peptidoglycan-binding domain-containing protein [Acrocarpospora catenulata]|uniref:LysM peptidoglycan-binding domain-containing protein n=1 Tax=Acrocarpospora catenulata TaxID=2836182 RepID=UPI001BD9C477|nr:LysM peptidoglycan-binding domain-containing protein [Acrocarpospora catenulata]
MLVAIVAGLALTVLWLGTRAAVTASTSPVGPDRSGLPWVTVQDGDTLWEIAVAVGEDENPAELIRQIKNINGLSDSLIRPGTKLYLPSGHAG